MGIDFAIDDTALPKGQAIFLNFKTQEAGFIAGYAAAKYLSEKYAGATEAAKRVLSGFGGGAFAAVTDFLAGYLSGVFQYNITVDADQTVKFSSDNVVLDTGFTPTIDADAKVAAIVNNKQPKIILPVAGVLTNNTLAAVKKNGNQQFVIGVDSNQAVAIPNSAEQFFTSIEKRTGYTVYQTYADLLLNKADSSVFLQQDTQSRFKFGVSNVNLVKGFDAKFVNYSRSLVPGEDGVKINADLKAAEAIFQNRSKLSLGALKTYASSSEATALSSFFGSMLVGGLNATTMFQTEYMPLLIPNMKNGDKNQEILNFFIKNFVNQINKTNVNTKFTVNVDATTK